MSLIAAREVPRQENNAGEVGAIARGGVVKEGEVGEEAATEKEDQVLTGGHLENEGLFQEVQKIKAAILLLKPEITPEEAVKCHEIKIILARDSFSGACPITLVKKWSEKKWEITEGLWKSL